MSMICDWGWKGDVVSKYPFVGDNELVCIYEAGFYSLGPYPGQTPPGCVDESLLPNGSVHMVWGDTASTTGIVWVSAVKVITKGFKLG